MPESAIADLDAGQRHADQAEHAAEGHHHRERDGQQPDRRRAELRAPEPDRDHRQHVVEAGDRVAQAGEEALRAALPRRGRRRARGQQRDARAKARTAARTPARAARAARVGSSRVPASSISVRWIVQYAPSEPTA